ncbi:hypothetical protein ABRP72_08370 [Pectobacterium carotovorum]|uniref:hypothetical protein n=1 Tax=Pectobacterium carotovorum TaxID=554 RepID=UPI0032EC3282
MANLSENPQWVDGIYQIEMSDPVVGGPDGVSNRQAKELASRTSYLKKEQEKTGSDLATHVATVDPHTQYAPKANPTFTGMPKAPMPAPDSNSQQVATTAFVRSVGATKLERDQNGADILDRELFNRNLGSSRAYSSSIPIGGSAGLWTTAEFTDWLERQGAFVHAYWVCRGSWSYAHNKIISDTGCGQIPLAGSVVEVMGQHAAITIRVTTPSTTPSGLSDSANAQFTYVYNGIDYSPGWRRDYNTKNKPTAADIGVYSKLETDIVASAATTAANNAATAAANANTNANSRVPSGRRINGKELSADITLNAGDVGAYTSQEVDEKIARQDSPFFIGSPRLTNTPSLGNGTNLLANTIFVQRELTRGVAVAERLATPRSINGVAFDGTTNIALTPENIGALPVAGTAVAATKLATPRKINGVEFDGSKDITLTPENLGFGEIGLVPVALLQFSSHLLQGLNFKAVSNETLEVEFEIKSHGRFVDVGKTQLFILENNAVVISGKTTSRFNPVGKFIVTSMIFPTKNNNLATIQINYKNHGVPIGSVKVFRVAGFIYREIGCSWMGHVSTSGTSMNSYYMELKTPLSSPNMPVMGTASFNVYGFDDSLGTVTIGADNQPALLSVSMLGNSAVSFALSDNEITAPVVTDMATIIVYDIK